MSEQINKPMSKRMLTAMTKDILFGEMPIRVYSVRYLGMSLHRTPYCIKSWIREKILPRPIITLKDGCLWFTKDEVDLYKRLVEEEQVKNGKSIQKTKFIPRAKFEAALLSKKWGKIIETASK